MPRRDISLTLALCASLAIHALLLASTAEFYIKQFGSHITLSAPALPLPPIEPLLQADDNPWNRLGDSNATGNATGNSPGEQPMVGREGSQNQPFLSLDPPGQGKVGDAPTDSVLPIGGGQPSAPAPQEAAAAAPQSTPYGITDEQLDEFAPPKKTPKMTRTQASDSTPTQSTPANSMPAQSPQAPSPMQPGASASADPAPQANTESDPVTTIGGADFRMGSASVRLGRKYKLTRPHLSLAAQADLMTTAKPGLVLKIKIDSTGKVISAEIYRSSGSNAVDQPCKVAAYDWWFEPPRDAGGKPTGDVILFYIRFI